MNSDFKFINPGKVKLLAGRTSEQKTVVDTSKEQWHWEDGGRNFKIDWTPLKINSKLKELLKAYIFYRLENYAPYTVYTHDAFFVRVVPKSILAKDYPWSIDIITKYLSSSKVKKNPPLFFSFQSFYKWGLDRKFLGFEKKTLDFMSESQPNARSAYDEIFLRQNIITPAEELKIIKFIESSYDDQHFIECRDNVILHLGFELGPRPIQIHSLDEGDYSLYSINETSYCSINLPMAKKIRSGPPEKRPRSISSSLGKKIAQLILYNKQLPTNVTKALFRDFEGGRLSSPEVSTIVGRKLQHLGFEKGDSLTLLRHHVAQSLADQGASAEVIAEILGHNSTVPARAYVGATPEISEIKSRALGKNQTYLDIMKMLITGDIIEKDNSSKERWVKGMIGSQYIGGIGSCGLPNNTSCPKNPVYSCYTCQKFHPFRDGNHIVVKDALINQSHFFLDIAEEALLLENNRSVTQLEITINAVDSVIQKCGIKSIGL